jgi:hypothetical protein
MELKSTTKWPVKITRDEGSMGYQDNLRLEKHEELQLSRLCKEDQSIK